MFKIITKTISVDYVEFDDGYTHELNDLWSLLDEVDGGNIIVTDYDLGQRLIDLKVLSSLGSERSLTCARKGINFDDFFKQLTAKN